MKIVGILRESSNLKTRKEKAITLIALVITIIVLLILAGVTVATLTGENGLLSKAATARQRNEEAEQDERETLNSIENEMSKYGTWERTGGTVTISSAEYARLLKASNALNYSTEQQQEVGTWINNKPIYQKTINIGTVSKGNSNIATISNLETMVDYSGIFTLSNGNSFTIPYGYNGIEDVSLYKSGSNIGINNGIDSELLNTYITIQYTTTSTSSTE